MSRTGSTGRLLPWRTGGGRYAVVGGNAVAAWVSRIDTAAVRNTRDVDLLLRREDMGQATAALEAAGFVHHRVASPGKATAMDVFLDGPDAKVRDAIHILWAGEKAVPDAIEPTPELTRTEVGDDFQLVPLEDLVRMIRTGEARTHGFILIFHRMQTVEPKIRFGPGAFRFALEKSGDYSSVMHCPFCQSLLQVDVSECPACRLTFPRTSAVVGALPRFAPVVADTTRSLAASEQAKLKSRIGEMQRRFPQLVVQVVVHQFSEEHPFSMHVFWMFNAGNFAGDSRRGKDNHAVLVALDPTRGEAAIMPGYGLESFLKAEALDHLLELAGPAWENGRWADGIFRVLDGLDQLLESIALPNDGLTLARGEF